VTLVITNITKEIDISEDGLQETKINEHLESSKNGNDVQVKDTVSSCEFKEGVSYQDAANMTVTARLLD
jgi:hypothetical protein